MRKSSDLSLLAWEGDGHFNDDVSVLADDPRRFRNTQSIVHTNSGMEDFSLRNRGPRIKLPLIHDGNTLGDKWTCTAVLPT